MTEKTTRRKLLAGAAAVGGLSLAGCISEGEESPPQSAEADQNAAKDVERFIDNEAGVVCWKFDDRDGYAGQGGLSCLPIEETDLANRSENDSL